MSRSRDLALQAVDAACSKNAIQPMLLDVTGVASYTDYILVLSGRSMRQVRAIADAVEQGLKQRGYDAIGREGELGGQWILLDFGDLVVHVFFHAIREFYNIEGLWAEAVHVPLNVPVELKTAYVYG